MEYFKIIVLAILINNIVLTQFLGICPFLGVSGRYKASLGMSAAVIIIMTLSSVLTFLIFNYILKPLNAEFLQTITFIIVIAALVQSAEIIIKVTSPSLFKALGIYLPLITTNCAILGVSFLAIQKNLTFLQTTVYSAATGVGFALAMIIMAGIREQLEIFGVPKKMEGIPIALITAGILALAFMGFTGVIR